MGLYLYCVVPPDHAVPEGLTGIAAAPVRAMAFGPVAAWASELARRPEPELESIRRHNAVVEAAMSAEVTPVPVRFGQWTADEGALATLMEPRVHGYAALLQAFAGAVEMGLRVLDPAAGPPAPQAETAPASGREYLRRRAEAEARRSRLDERGAALARELRDHAGTWVLRERVQPFASTHGVLDAAHLVKRHDTSSYRRAIETFRAAHPELRFLVSGPWPPYSFAE